MAISNNYIANSTARHFHTNDLDFDFKTFNTPFTEMTDLSDLSFGISTNEHSFYNDFTWGIPDAKGMFGNDGIATNVYNDNADFVSTSIRPTYCLVYYTNDQSVGYFRNMLANFKYINFTTGETNINTPCYLVTDFNFNNIILQLGTSQKDISQNIYASETPLTVKEFWDGDDGALNNVYIPYLHYWTGSNTISIDNFFELYSVIQLNGETIAYKITNNNILSTLVSPPISQGVETDDFSGVGYVGLYERFQGKMINGKPFNHVCNASNYEVLGDQTRNTPTDGNELGCSLQPQYISPFILYYGNICRKDYFINIVASTGLRFMNVYYTRGISVDTYNREISIAYMGSDGIVDWTNIIKGLNNINNSDSYNKNIDYSTLPDIDYERKKPDDKDNIEPIHTRSFSDLTGFTKYYKMTSTRLDTFINACQQAGSVKTGFEYMPFITSVKQYPFNINNYVITEDHASTIKINGVTLDGSYVTEDGITATGHKLTGTQLPINNIGTVHIPRKHNNFLDFAPYTTIEVYIPLCGFVTLPSHCMDKDISVVLIMDVINGTCKGVVYCDSIPVAEKSGICGRDITLSGIETGLKTASVISSASGLASSALGLTSGVMTGNPVAVGYSAVSAISATSQMLATMNNSHTRTTGNMGDITNFHDSSCCYLKITTPVNKLPNSYGKNVGYVCNKTKQLSTCKGYTVIENPELNLNCNYDEEVEIKSLLQSGVIIK